MFIQHKQTARSLTAAAVALFSAFLLLVVSARPSAAAEGNWYEVDDAPSEEAVATASWNDGDLFHVWRGSGQNERLYVTTSPSAGPFRAISEIPGGGRTENMPSVAMRDQHPVVFHVGTNGGIFYQTYRGATNGGWEGTWHSLDGNFAQNSVAVASFNHGHFLVVTYRGTNNRMYIGWFDSEMRWHPAGEIPGDGTTLHSPAIAVVNDGGFYVTHTGTNGHVYYTYGSFDPSGLADNDVDWIGRWIEIPGLVNGNISTSHPTMVSYGPDTDTAHNTVIDVAVVDDDLGIQWAQWRAGGGGWGSWRQIRASNLLFYIAPILWTWRNQQAILYYTGRTTLYGKTLSTWY
ncbi:hypothetical protein [Streptomyces sp. NBC_01217]|uniref:hypothetical protein n=1 Tax=Streptomyces sp. NBC_01217 TaxID=2903779 RepID=UPI002E146AD1|nr:hypothetical protein OG507_00030 [Streptomyces sp. NBC_01217]WSQ62591.1 hypothetical protein OG507_39540 [Streptomyces sp. NBC_01217]